MKEQLISFETAKLAKDSWNREEVESLCKKAYSDAELSNLGDTVEDWIKENL